MSQGTRTWPDALAEVFVMKVAFSGGIRQSSEVWLTKSAASELMMSGVTFSTGRLPQHHFNQGRSLRLQSELLMSNLILQQWDGGDAL